MPDPGRVVRVVAGAGEVAREAAAELRRRAARAVEERGAFSVALSGGSTPRGLYTLLAEDARAAPEDRLPWERIHVFFGDERHVPPDHPESNYRMAREALLDRVPLPPANVHRVRAEDPDAERAARAYEGEIRAYFQPAPGRLPRFDLVLLGMGEDGHTASLFPGSETLHDTTHLVAAPWIEKIGRRFTLTLPVLNAAACALFLVSGPEKARALREVLEGGPGPDPLPARRVRPADGELLWIVDRAAARSLSP